MMSVFNASDYTVSVSTDGPNFTRVIDVTGNSLGLCAYSFEQIPAAYIKVKITKGSIIDNATYYLAEVMAYGTAYTGSTDGMTVRLNAYAAGTDTETTAVPRWQPVLIAVFSVILAASVAACVTLAVRSKKKQS